MCRISKITVERYPSAFGIQHATPRLSWRFEGNSKDWHQASYSIRINSPLTSDIETFEVRSESSVFVPWPSTPLRSREQVSVSVQATSTSGKSTPWETVHIETALLRPEDWVADVTIGEPQSKDLAKRPFHVKRTFTLLPANVSARLYITALGVYQVSINGQRIGDHVLAPGWQSYQYRLHYQTFDITPYLVSGANEIVALVGEGWYAGRLGWEGGRRNIYGDDIGLIAQLEIDGKVLVKTGEEGWLWSYGEIIASELYDGEVFDGNEAISSSSKWTAARSTSRPNTHLISPEAPPVRKQHTLSAIEKINTPSGKTVFDFGQNFVGWVKLENIPPNSHLVLRHAEVMEHKELGTRPLRLCKATDIITTGSETRNWEPTYTFHGFRYLEIDGWEAVELKHVNGVVIYSDMERLGDFSCSHTGLTKFHENTLWGLRGNFVSVPTDCPQRDERLGWTGDLQVFCPTANFLYNTNGLLSNWLHDLSYEQNQLDGLPPLVVPNILTQRKRFAIWGDVTASAPNDLFHSFDDMSVLQDQWESMDCWMTQGVTRDPKTGLWDPTAQQLGDWLDPAAPEDRPDDSHSDSILVANAHLVHTTRVISDIAKRLGRSEDAKRYQEDYERLLRAFRAEYITANGMIMSDTQTTLALALHFGLVPAGAIGRSAERLNYHVRRTAFKIGTGFAGTPVILPALANNGYLDTAYRMFQEKQCPSLLYPISQGATTMWERWNSILPDGTINSGEMTSFNHYALGSVSRFLYESVGGLSILEPGWKKALIQPRPGGSVKSAKVSHLSPYGFFACDWNISNDQLVVNVSIPPNALARVVLPGLVEEVGSGERQYTVAWDGSENWPVRVLQPPPMRPQLIDEVIL